jgi:hypothetical protein
MVGRAKRNSRLARAVSAQYLRLSGARDLATTPNLIQPAKNAKCTNL